MIDLIATLLLGATIPVTTKTDAYVDDASCSLREAITAANTDAAFYGCSAGAGADTITLPSGTYTLLQQDGSTSTWDSAPTGPSNLDNATNDLDIFSDITIQGSGDPSLTLITGNNSAPVFDDQLFEVTSPGTLRLRNVTITTLHSVHWTPARDGAAIYVNDAGVLDVVNCSISNNVGTFNGAAIFNRLSTVRVDRTKFLNNSTGAHGGALFNLYGTFLITNSLFDGNTAAQYGAAAYSNAGTIELRNCTVTNNTSASGASVLGGGGIANTYMHNNSPSDCSPGYSMGYNATDAACGSGGVTGDLIGQAPTALHDAGNPNGCTDGTDLLTFDLPGNKRHQGAACDIGATEQVDPNWADLAVTVNAETQGPAGQPLDVLGTVEVGDRAGTAAGTVTLAFSRAVSVESASTTQGSCSTSSLAITCPISVSSNTTIQVYATITSNVGGSVTITASHNVLDPLAANDQDTTSSTFIAVADTTVDLSGSPGAVVGVAYPLTVTPSNLGPSAVAGLSTVITLPEGVSAVASGCTLLSQTLTCDGDGPFSLSLTPNEAGDFTVSATVSSGGSDPNTGNNTATIDFTAVVQAALSVTSSAPSVSPEAGAQFDVTITISNAGPSPAAAVMLALSFPELTVLAPSCAPNCDLGSIAAGAHVDLVVTLRASNPGDYMVTSTATAGTVSSDNNVDLTVVASVAPGNGLGDASDTEEDSVGTVGLGKIKGKGGCSAAQPNDFLPLLLLIFARKRVRRRV